MENSFNEKNKEYLEKKFEIENACKREIAELSESYKSEALDSGFKFDEESKTFKLDSYYVLDYQICSFGRPGTKPEFKLVHKVINLPEEKFMDYASYLTDIKVGNASYMGVTRAKILAQIFSEDVQDFYKLLKDASKSNYEKGPTLLLEQGFTSRSFNAFYPSDGKAYSYYKSIDIINYYGGFSIRMTNLSATFHLYQVSKDSKNYIDEYLSLESKGLLKITETYFGVNDVIYKWG